MRPLFVLLALAFTLGACASSGTYVSDPLASWDGVQPPPRTDLAYRLFLVGNVAAEAGEETPALDALRAQLAEAGEQSAVVLLGDQLLRPLPDSLAANRAAGDASLDRVAALVEGYPGRVVVLPGDRDRGDGDALERQADGLADRLGRDVLRPEGGLAGPSVIELTDDLILVALDTEWWLRDPDDRPTGEIDGDEIESEVDVVVRLNEIIEEYDDERIVVAGHHPVFSTGARAGQFALRQHLFPLTDLWRPLYVPLPIIGSAYPLFRSYFGGRQDFSNEDYRELRDALPEVLSEHDGVVYAASHEYGLQYIPFRTDALELQHHVVSGGGARGGPLAGGSGAGFTQGTAGFASLQFYEDDTMWLEFWEPDGTPGGSLAFRTKLEEPRGEAVDPEVPDIDPAALPDYTDSTRVAVADPTLGAGPVKRFFFGDNYRDVWTAPVAVPVLDLGRAYGGLTPLKRGGGYQTVSLRLANPEGREFVLRQVQKRPDLLLPPALRNTFAADVLSDQISSSNPYGALVVPRLADAAGIYHTNPQIVVVPDDPRLGVYRETFANTLVLFEERPTDEAAGLDKFGNAEDIDGSATLFRELREDNDTRVDQPFFLRNRLFDLLIGDWDRHEDQWRWAQFEPFMLDATLEGDARTEGKVYRPIPRDRDQVFFRLTGLLPSIAQKAVRGLQDFDPEYGDLIGLTDNGLFQDRRFLNELTRDDWQAIARDLQARMTDDVLRDALDAWPDEVDALHGERVLRTLQSRRDRLPEVADEFYELLAGTVDIVGSDKHERFVVEREGEATTVTVSKTSKKGEDRRQLYRRTFFDGETDEIRLYGLGGRDRFEIRGDGGGPYVRVVGGTDEDEVDAEGGASGRLHVYDTERGNEIGAGRARVTLSDDPAVNRYDPQEFSYPERSYLPVVGYSATEGVAVGASVIWTRPKFRREPYGIQHQITATVATGTGAVSAAYRSHWVEGVGRFDVFTEVEGATPQDVYNFYGLGNETTDDLDEEFYRVRQASAAAAFALGLTFREGAAFGLGPAAEVTFVEQTEGRILGDLPADAEVFDGQAFVGGDAFAVLHYEDRLVNPQRGFRWENRAGIRTGVANAGDTFAPLSSALAVYLSPSLSPQVTLALRVGAEHVAGDFPFYRAATLGGVENLRGYRSTRFAGRSAFYQNAELRIALLDFRTYAAGGTLGVLGFVDNGRVWADGEGSSTWHQGYGGGLWVNLFDLALLRGTVGVSPEGALVNIGLGFLY
ncbi:MAG: BamA/TamA family outer membrane protein [Rhodothermales bacterium]